jgi:uncharacterized repeat protein (TIGR04138 family)
MQKLNFSESIDTILKQDSRYDRDSYYFVREGLDYTLKMLKKNAQSQPAQRHVSGQELLEGLRRYVIDQFGPMAKTVLAYWGIHRCDDFGEVVFNMVEKGILGKTEQDSREDFKGGYDFDEAFVKPYQPLARPNASRHRIVASAPADASYRGEKTRSSGSGKLSSGSN